MNVPARNIIKPSLRHAARIPRHVAGIAAVLALTMWRTGALTFVTDHSSDLQALLPTVQVTLPEKQPPKLLPEKLGRPVTSRPGENIYTRVSSVLESLLNAAENIKS